ncbi:hypothetical protein ACH79_00495 [Bradyrhizobium sp. CCBAU 051011]|nr:hypothetical protein ACH79_00495 [Bradyrhizobium sp. CCBAU 051011]
MLASAGLPVVPAAPVVPAGPPPPAAPEPVPAPPAAPPPALPAPAPAPAPPAPAPAPPAPAPPAPAPPAPPAPWATANVEPSAKNNATAIADTFMVVLPIPIEERQFFRRSLRSYFCCGQCADASRRCRNHSSRGA